MPIQVLALQPTHFTFLVHRELGVTCLYFVNGDFKCTTALGQPEGIAKYAKSPDVQMFL